MKEVAADIWVLTETWVDFSPGDDYQLLAKSCAAADLATSPDRCWVTIWSRLSGKRMDVQRQADRMVCGLIQRPSGSTMLIVGTVLPWFSDKLWPGAAGFCDALGGQVAEWNRLHATYISADFIVAGDFNQSLPYQQHYGSKLGAKALDDAIQIHGLLCLTEGNDPLTGKPRIDHLCVSQNTVKTNRQPVAETWQVPLIRRRKITDHSGACVQTDV
jgi:hypothetical protein